MRYRNIGRTADDDILIAFVVDELWQGRNGGSFPDGVRWGSIPRGAVETQRANKTELLGVTLSRRGGSKPFSGE